MNSSHRKSRSIFILFCIIVFSAACSDTTITCKEKVFRIELGTELSLNTEDYATGTTKDLENSAVDLSSVDQARPGTYEGKIVYKGKKEYPFQIEIADTVNPTGEIAEGKQVAANVPVNAMDFVTNIVDASEVEVGFYREDTASLEKSIQFTETGSYSQIIRLKDGSGNYTDYPVQFEVVDSGAVIPTGEFAAEMFAGNIDELDTSRKDWGFGKETDEKNRPVDAVMYQKTYGKYGAEFIKESSGKQIYLTIDEGYENGYTEKILDVLKEKNCPVVFFVTKPYVEANPGLIKRMIEEGHVVGNHSVTHPAEGMPSLSVEQQREEIRQLHEYVKENFHYDMYLFRNPAGIFSEQSLAVTYQEGYRSIFWSFAYRDWIPEEQPEKAEALDTLMKKLHPGAIYLLHAVSKTNTEIIGDFIDDAREAGYEFLKYN